jgi:predicted  nucleic acid-binding Zn-ribbon protein
VINRKIKTSQARQNAIVSEAKEYTTKIATLKAQIRRSQDPDEKAELRDEIDDLKSAYSSLNGEFMSLETTISTAQDLKDDRQRELNRAKAQLKARLDAREQEEQEQQSASEQLNADYDATFDELLQGYAVTTNGPESQAAYLYHATKNLLVAHLESMGSARPRTRGRSDLSRSSSSSGPRRLSTSRSVWVGRGSRVLVGVATIVARPPAPSLLLVHPPVG